MRIGKKSLLSLVFLLLLLLQSAYAATVPEPVNLIQNGNFSDADANGLPAHWTTSMWLPEEVITEISAVEDAERGLVMQITSYDMNDARIEQRIAVRPRTVYKFSAYIWAEGVQDEDGQGGNLSVADTMAYSDSVTNTYGTWQKVELVGRTSDTQTELQLWCRLGGYGKLSMGTVRFSDVRCEEVDEVAAQTLDVQDFTPMKTQQAPPENTDVAKSVKHELPFELLYAALFLVFALWMYQLLQTRKKPFSEMGAQLAFFAILVVGVVVRLYLAQSKPGYQTDMDCFNAWGNWIAERMPWGFYNQVDFCDYPPGYMLILWPFTLVRNGMLALVNQSPDWVKFLGTAEQITRMWIKMPALIADILTSVFVYKIARKHERKAHWYAFLGALILLNPAYLVNSASWGQIDSILTLLLVVSIYWVTQKKMLKACLVYTCALLIKPQALMLGLVLLLAYIGDFVQAKRDKQPLWRMVALPMLRDIGCSLALFFAVVLLFNGSQSFPVWIFEKYFGTMMEQYQYASVNAFNLFSLVGLNWVEQTPVVLALGTLFLVLVCLFVTWLYVRCRNRNALPLVGALIVFGVYMLAMRMHERYVFPVMLLLLLAYILMGDRRLLKLFLGISATSYVSIGLVLTVTHVMPALGWAYTVMRMICAINLVMLAWLVYVAWDLCVRGHVLGDEPFQPAFGDALRPEQPLPTKSDTQGELPPLPEALPRMKLPTLHTVGDEGRMKMSGKNWLFVVGLTLVYAVVSIVNLGTLKAPETWWQSNKLDQTLTIDLGQERQIDRLYYYVGICSGEFRVDYSQDGENWKEYGSFEIATNTMFEWHMQQLVTGAEVQVEGEDPVFLPMTARYVRIAPATIGIRFHEIGFGNKDGERYPAVAVYETGGRSDKQDLSANAIDEFNTIPELPSYFNGMYFDEVYHARTAYEHLNLMEWYETTHPPLGKVFISLGIAIFGMNPFGWRIAGTLFGVFMVPAMFFLLKTLFRKDWIIYAGTLLMTFDFMHFAQTRVATIDSYAVFFIMLMYLFMFRYMQRSSFHGGVRRTLWPLFWSGLFMGLGMASKWIGIYAGGGLAILFLYTQYRRFREWQEAKQELESGELRGKKDRKFLERVVRQYPHDLLITLGCCVVFFILIPVAIYVASYTQYLMIPGKVASVRDVVNVVWDAQKSMFSYHSKLVEETPHPYNSPWYEWPLMIRPIFYYMDSYPPAGWAGSINSFGNPAVWWPGFVAILYIINAFVRGRGQRDDRVHMVLIGLAAQFLPWTFVPRSTYIYHYFASIPFLIICLLLIAEALEVRWKPTKKVVACWLGVTVLLFVLFYPLLSGVQMPKWYLECLRWLPSWSLFG